MWELFRAAKLTLGNRGGSGFGEVDLLAAEGFDFGARDAADLLEGALPEREPAQ